MEKLVICDFCKQEIEDKRSYLIYSYVIDTDKRPAYIGLKKVLEGLSDYLMDKHLHLSGSQIILFRPDIMKQYIETIIRTDEKIISFGFMPYVICYECYDEYDKQVPLL